MGKTLASSVETPKYIVELPSPPPKEFKFNCPNCDKKFVKLSRLKMHQATHLTEKPFKCSFEGCESSYYRKNHLKRHEATRHLIMGGDYKCTFDGCFASFETSTSLYFHNKRKHCERKFSCRYCMEMFSKKYQLKEHELDHAEISTLPFKCGVKGCNEEFRSHAIFKSHQKLHRKRRITGDEQEPQRNTYSCSDCDDVFEKWSSYLEHKKLFHRVFIECTTCCKKISKSHFPKHVKIHEEERHLFPCTYKTCSKSYRHSQNLAHHIRVCHEDRAFICAVCSRKLSTKQKLDHHVKTIHENPPIALSNIQREETFSLNKLVNMLNHEVDFEITRRGPPVGVS